MYSSVVREEAREEHGQILKCDRYHWRAMRRDNYVKIK
jgi:hypothetical protein